MAGQVTTMKKEREEYKVLVGRPEGKRQLERHTCRWQENITVDLKRNRTRQRGLESCALGQDHLAIFYENGKEPSSFMKYRNCLTSLRTAGFSRNTWFHGIGCVFCCLLLIVPFVKRFRGDVHLHLGV